MKPRISTFGGQFFVSFITNEGSTFRSSPYEEYEVALFILEISYLTGKVQYIPA